VTWQLRVLLAERIQPFTTQETEEAFFDAAGRLMWRLYCG
jgi:hypothetical protein